MKSSKDYELFKTIAYEVFMQGTNWNINLDTLPPEEKKFHIKAFPEAMVKGKSLCDYSKIKLGKHKDLFIRFLTEELISSRNANSKLLGALEELVNG